MQTDITDSNFNDKLKKLDEIRINVKSDYNNYKKSIINTFKQLIKRKGDTLGGINLYLITIDRLTNVTKLILSKIFLLFELIFDLTKDINFKNLFDDFNTYFKNNSIDINTIDDNNCKKLYIFYNLFISILKDNTVTINIKEVKKKLVEEFCVNRKLDQFFLEKQINLIEDANPNKDKYKEELNKLIQLIKDSPIEIGNDDNDDNVVEDDEEEEDDDI